MYENERAQILEYAAGDELCRESVALDRCAGMMTCETEALEPEAQGRIVELTVRLRNICPGRRTALGVLLHETDENGREHPRGMRTVMVPAHSEPSGCDILVRNIRFVLPEELSLAGEDCQRRFVVRTLAHYIDVDECASCACRIR